MQNLFLQTKSIPGWRPANIAVEDMLRLGLTMGNQELRNPVTQINGIKIICDWKEASLSQLRYMTPRICYNTYQSFLVSGNSKKNVFKIIIVLTKYVWKVAI